MTGFFFRHPASLLVVEAGCPEENSISEYWCRDAPACHLLFGSEIVTVFCLSQRAVFRESGEKFGRVLRSKLVQLKQCEKVRLSNYLSSSVRRRDPKATNEFIVG